VREKTTGSKIILGIHFDLISWRNAFEIINRWRAAGLRRYVTITNPHSVMLCRRDRAMLKATQAAGLTLPDGVGIVLAARLLGYRNAGRVTGPEFMLRCCDWGREYGYRHYLYGGGEGVAEKLAVRLSAAFPGMTIAGYYCPPFRALSEKEDAGIVERINGTSPDIVWVGLGAPKQEKWMADHLGRLNATTMIGVGAAFDFHAGIVKWAPAWIRWMGMEWLYRLVREPRRMWRRNLDSPLFMAEVVWQRAVRAFRAPAQRAAREEEYDS